MQMHIMAQAFHPAHRLQVQQIVYVRTGESTRAWSLSNLGHTDNLFALFADYSCPNCRDGNIRSPLTQLSLHNFSCRHYFTSAFQNMHIQTPFTCCGPLAEQVTRKPVNIFHIIMYCKQHCYLLCVVFSVMHFFNAIEGNVLSWWNWGTRVSLQKGGHKAWSLFTGNTGV